MPNFIIRSTSAKGNFELLTEDDRLLYTVSYKNWFSGEANTEFDNSAYSIRSANFWQTQFDILRDDNNIGRISFNWKGEIIINYTSREGDEKEMLLQYKGVWKFRFVLSDRSEHEILAMVSFWSKLKYHYDVSIIDDTLSESETKELLMIAGYCANLYMNTLVAIY
jgi:hypothetical protein